MMRVAKAHHFGFYALLLGLALALLAGCGPAAPAPSTDLLGAKQLATVYLTPTRVSTLVVPFTPTRVVRPTATPVPPLPTRTRTPYVGVFMGDGSAPVVLPTAAFVAVEATLIPPTPLGGGGQVSTFPTATIPFGVSGGVNVGDCGVQLAAEFVNARNDPTVAQMLGCPSGPPQPLFMAEQRFENGVMFWTSNSQIYALSSQAVDGVSLPFWRVQDTWTDGQPQDDPNMVVPSGYLQPIRGFGLAWRTNGAIRNALGWAVSGEGGYNGTVQQFQGGLMLTGQAGSVYALVNADPSGIRGSYVGPLF